MHGIVRSMLNVTETRLHKFFRAENSLLGGATPRFPRRRALASPIPSSDGVCLAARSGEDVHTHLHRSRRERVRYVRIHVKQ
jgi:hypothetical protein